MKIGLKTTTLDRDEILECGACVRETCTPPNYHISEFIRISLAKDYDIKLYGYIIPHTYNNITILGEDVKVLNDTKKVYETKFIEKFKKFYGKLPITGNNYEND